MKQTKLLVATLAAAAVALAATICSYNTDAQAGQAAVDPAAARVNTATSAAPAPVTSNNPNITAAGAAAAMPNDPYYPKQWALPVLQTAASNAANREVIVAVLDSGIDASHEDLSGKIVGSVNFSASATESDLMGHGTHVAGIVAANANNGIGIAGVAPDVKLLNVKVVDDKGKVWSSTAAKGIIWAVDHGASVINMSFTLPERNEGLADAVKYAASHNVIMVAAAGNRVSGPVYPAAYTGVISVAALNPDGTLWSGSDHSVYTVVAPGAEIYSTVPGSKYTYKSGSSMAAAYVSGLAAEMLGNTVEAGETVAINGEIQAALATATAALKN